MLKEGFIIFHVRCIDGLMPREVGQDQKVQVYGYKAKAKIVAFQSLLGSTND